MALHQADRRVNTALRTSLHPPKLQHAAASFTWRGRARNFCNQAAMMRCGLGRCEMSMLLSAGAELES